MIEIHPGVFIGSQDDFEQQVKGQSGWRVVHACKDPYHRQFVGYSTRGAPPGPEYLIAHRGDEIALNLIDPQQIIPYTLSLYKAMIESALLFIQTSLADGKKVLVHCNLGESRAPMVGLFFLLQAKILQGNLAETLNAFQARYPTARFSPMMHYVIESYYREFQC